MWICVVLVDYFSITINELVSTLYQMVTSVRCTVIATLCYPHFYSCSAPRLISLRADPHLPDPKVLHSAALLPHFISAFCYPFSTQVHCTCFRILSQTRVHCDAFLLRYHAFALFAPHSAPFMTHFLTPHTFHRALSQAWCRAAPS